MLGGGGSWTGASGGGGGGSFGSLTGAPTDNAALATALAAKESTANKGVANGYVPLSSTSKISFDYLGMSIFFFGDGSDGDLILSSGTVTHSRDMFYNNVTLSGTVTMTVTSWRTFIAGTLDITNAPFGAIRANGASGNNGNTGGAGGATGAAAAAGTICGTGAGGATVNGTTGAAAVATATTAVISPTGGGAVGAIGSGGQGGGGGSGAGGIGSSTGSPGANSYFPIKQPIFSSLRGSSQIFAGQGGRSGSSGAGNGTDSGPGGGGAGASGGAVFLYARKLNRGPSTAAGAIQARGGNGGNGANGQSSGCGGSGGGGSGSGGYIHIVAGELLGSVATNALDLSAGQAGNGGNGNGIGNGGNSGGNGSGGRATVFNLATGTLTDYTGAAVTSGVLQSGGIGGTAVAVSLSQTDL